jgi:acetyl esterase/lipase
MMDPLPAPLRPLEDERRLLEQCLDAMEAAEDAVERADLAQGISLLAARYENVLADVLYPFLLAISGTQPVVTEAEALLKRVRAAVTHVRNETRNVKPINAYAHDADGFEEMLGTMTSTIRDLLNFENTQLFPLAARLNEQDGDSLSSQLVKQMSHETSLPDPPDNAVLRKVAEFKETFRLAFRDESTRHHPGLDKVVDDELG